MAKEQTVQAGLEATLLTEHKPTRTQAANFSDSYANSVEVRSSFFDFRFIFGTIADPSDGAINIEDHTKIYMSPQHAKLFLRIFTNNLQKYEEKFGGIPELPEFKSAKK